MDTSLPEDGVRVIPAIGRLKLRRLVPAGSVSKIVTVTFAFPLPPQSVQGLLGPLQEDNDIAATATRSVNPHFQFIEHPIDRIPEPIGHLPNKSQEQCSPKAGWRGVRIRQSVQLLTAAAVRNNSGTCDIVKEHFKMEVEAPPGETQDQGGERRAETATGCPGAGVCSTRRGRRTPQGKTCRHDRGSRQTGRLFRAAD